MNRLTIALDAMSGDYGPVITIPAALQALKSYSQLKLLIVGNPTIINKFLMKMDYLLFNRITVIPSESIIANNIKPSHAIKISQGTSMRTSIELIKSGDAQACISAGNTGALMSLSKLVLKPLEGIYRPALMIILPNQKQRNTIVLDLGANIKCDSNMLVQFAIMGAIIAKQIIGISIPKVALLNIGEEEMKGFNHIHEAAKVLRNISTINYVGYIEANELLMGKIDVLVCDGFIGNIALKTMEGVTKVFLSLLKFSTLNLNQNWFIKIAAHWVKKKIVCQFDQLNPDQYNGACLIGLHGIVIKSHGSANKHAFITAIKQAIYAIEHQIPKQIASHLNKVHFKIIKN